MGRPGLSKGEMLVARVLWESGAGTVRDIHSRLGESESMEMATVQTYLRRLEAKGYATSVLEGKVRNYRAKGQAKTVIRKTVDDLVSRLFAGDTLPLVKHLIEDRGLDADGLAELKELIGRLEREGDKR